MPTGDALPAGGPGGLLFVRGGGIRYALLPRDDDRIVDRDPRIFEECRPIRTGMRAGRSHSPDEAEIIRGDE